MQSLMHDYTSMDNSERDPSVFRSALSWEADSPVAQAQMLCLYPHTLSDDALGMGLILAPSCRVGTIFE